VHRYYDPATAQFISVDPAVNLTQASYSYAQNDPVNAIDPNGLLSLGDLNPVHVAESVGNAVVSGAGDVILGVGKVTTEVGDYVYHHPVQSAGLALGAVALATGVGALAEGVVIGGVELSAGTLGATSFVAGSVGSALDGPACLDGNDTAACVGLYLNALSTLSGGVATLTALLTEEGGPLLISRAYGGLAAALGLGGLGADLYSLLASCG
jgi:hypothetical protein